MRGEACLSRESVDLMATRVKAEEWRQGEEGQAERERGRAVRETSRGRIVLVPFREATTPLTTPSRLSLPPRALAF